jgi:hypothetical protein
MFADIHGVDPAQFRASLGDPSRQGSAKKRRKDDEEKGQQPRESGLEEDRLEASVDAGSEHLDIRACHQRRNEIASSYSAAG